MSKAVKTRDPKAMPSGIPYIIGNEAAERFSYYGMRTILGDLGAMLAAFQPQRVTETQFSRLQQLVALPEFDESDWE